MKRVILSLILFYSPFVLFSQGTFKITNGAVIKSIKGAHLVLSESSLENDGVLQQEKDQGTLTFTGTLPVFISGHGVTQLDRFKINLHNNTSITLQSNISAGTAVQFNSGLLNLSDHTLQLGTTGALENESEASRAFSTGKGYIEAKARLNAPSAANVGNLGAIITSQENLGFTIIRRGHYLHHNIYDSNSSVLRYFDILPANNKHLNATLGFQYFQEELNKLSEHHLYLWKKTDNEKWSFLGSNLKDTTENRIEMATIDSFARLTLSTAAAPVLTCATEIHLNNDPQMNGALFDLTAGKAAMATGTPGPGLIYYIGNTIITEPYFFPIGTTTVIALASNGIQPEPGCLFMVTVKDTEKPTISSQSLTNAFCYQSNGYYTLPALEAADNVKEGLTVTYSISGATQRNGDGTDASGHFNVGTSTISWTVTDAAGNTANSNSTVIIHPLPKGTIPDVWALKRGAEVNTLYLGYGPGSLTLTAMPNGNLSGYTYQWTDGSKVAGNSKALEVSPSTPGVYTYTVTATDANGCSWTNSKQIKLVDIRCGENLDKVLVCRVYIKSDKLTDNCVAPERVKIFLGKGGYLGSCKRQTGLLAQTIQKETPENKEAKGLLSSNKLRLTALPNPSSRYFTLVSKSGSDKKIEIRITDQLGRRLENKIMTPNSYLQVGFGYRPGIYYVEAVQGKEQVTLKLIKN